MSTRSKDIIIISPRASNSVHVAPCGRDEVKDRGRKGINRGIISEKRNFSCVGKEIYDKIRIELENGMNRDTDNEGF